MKKLLVILVLLNATILVSCNKISMAIPDGDDSLNISDLEDKYKNTLSIMCQPNNDIRPLVMLHFSDIHSSLENGVRVMSFFEKYKEYIDEVICTGDLVGYSYYDDFSYWGTMGADSVLFCIGNHDSSDQYYNWQAFSSEDCYTRYCDRYIKCWNVVQSPVEKQSHVCYYYKDYIKQGIRLIVLDCMHYDAEQHEWFVKTLDDARLQRLSVLCADHFPLGMIDHSKNCFDAEDADEIWLNAGGGRLKSLIISFANKVVPVVGSFILKGGEFITWLFGHSHRDIFGTVDGCTNQLCIGVAETLWRDGYTGYYGDMPRNYGDKSQDLFNVISIDTIGKSLKLLRVGADMNKKGVKRLYINWDYKNNKQIE